MLPLILSFLGSGAAGAGLLGTGLLRSERALAPPLKQGI
jgi:hypothetical protein